jgi:hypothetical protein
VITNLQFVTVMLAWRLFSSGLAATPGLSAGKATSTALVRQYFPGKNSLGRKGD